ncbi:hypothetical protein TeGR_g4058, partial [Tetraparma gracilis]
CAVCGSGKYLSDAASDPALHTSESSCKLCPAGSMNEHDDTFAENHDKSVDCAPCTTGRYSDTDGSSSCPECTTGTSGVGATSCSDCPAGYECSDSKVDPCPAGKYSNNDSNCKGCDVGHRCPGGMDHQLCLPGTVQPATNQSTCVACTAGSYQDDQGKLACTPCPAGHFCPEASTTFIECGSVSLYCPTNSTSVKAAASGSYTTPVDADETARTGEAVCEAGFACVGGIKTSCDDGFSNPGSSKCEFCGPGKYMHEAEDSTKDCVGCQAGKYSETGSNSIEGCLTCGIGEYSSAASGFCSTVKAGEE